MRLVDADKLYPDTFGKGRLAVSQSQIADAPTVNAIPISVIEDIKAEIDNYISDFIATDIVLQIIDKHIRGDTDE